MNKQKLIGLIIGILLFIGVIAGLTYAYISWTSESVNKVVSSKCFNVLYDKGSDISGNIKPSADYTGGISATVKMDMDSSCNINAKGKIYITTNDTTSENLYTEGILNYQVLKNGNVTALKGTITSSGVITLDVGFLNSNTEATTTYTVYIWVNGEYVTNEHINSSYSGSIKSEALQTTEERPGTLIKHITNLYVNGNPTLITQETSNDSYYYSWQDTEQTWGLMNDGLKIDNTLDATTTGLATTVTDTTALTTGTEGNIRYFGPSDSVNNYIYFNCSDYSNQSDSTCEKWRIIGIVDGKVKIIRNEYIDKIAWDQDKNQDENLTTYSNNWETSSLQEFLNGLYYDRGTTISLDYYSNFDGSIVTTLNLEKIGITKATRINNLISNSTWYLGGYETTEGLYPNDIYNYERRNIVGTTITTGNPFTINENIGLMYASDFGYGTDLTKCNDDIYNYDSTTNSYACRSNNWLFNDFTWLLNNAKYIGSVMYVQGSGRVYRFNSNHYLFDVYPVLYLNSELVIESGHKGTSLDPYRISVS